MKLTYNQFELLINIEKNNGTKMSQRELASITKMSLGTINKIISEFNDNKLISINEKQEISITTRGYEVLEPYRVKRAIFLAAGFGSRLVPITLNTPKPLILVHGKKIIETLLDAVIAAEIEEIYIVRGYLGEQFDILLKKYPNIKFVDNAIYNEANNISSAVIVKDLFSNSYVLESDLLLSNPNIIRKYEYRSNFLGIYVDRTDDWCFETKNDLITKQKVGGTNCFQMVGISYYDAIDGKKLSKDIEEVFNLPGGREKYWDQVPLVERKQNYKIYVRECQLDDIVEIDTFKELKQIDKIYDV